MTGLTRRVIRCLDVAAARVVKGVRFVGLRDAGDPAAVERPELLGELAARFGSQCVVLSVDGRRRPAGEPGWEVVTHGGRRPSGRDALAWLVEGVERGAGEVLLTSIDGDGTLAGYDLELAGAAAVLAASIFHDGRYAIGEVKRFLRERGLPVREV